MATGQSISAQKGRSFLLKVSNAGSPPAYTTVAGMRTTEIAINGNPVDMSSKSSAGWRELLADGGLKTVDISGGGVWDSKSTELKTLQAAALAGGALIEAEIITGSADTFTGWFSVDTFTRSGPQADVETYACTLKSSGVVVFTAGP